MVHRGDYKTFPDFVKNNVKVVKKNAIRSRRIAFFVLYYHGQRMGWFCPHISLFVFLSL